jgi:hypothetical protein
VKLLLILYCVWNCDQSKKKAADESETGTFLMAWSLAIIAPFTTSRRE